MMKLKSREVAPPDIAPPQLDVTPIAVSATQSKPQINFNSGSGSMFGDGEYIPLFKVQQFIQEEHRDEGYVIVAFTMQSQAQYRSICN